MKLHQRRQIVSRSWKGVGRRHPCRFPFENADFITQDLARDAVLFPFLKNLDLKRFGTGSYPPHTSASVSGERPSFNAGSESALLQMDVLKMTARQVAKLRMLMKVIFIIKFPLCFWSRNNWANRSFLLLSRVTAPLRHQTLMRSGRIVHNLGYFCVTQFIIVESNIIDCAENNPLTSIRSMGVHFRVLALNVLSDNSCLFFGNRSRDYPVHPQFEGVRHKFSVPPAAVGFP